MSDIIFFFFISHVFVFCLIFWLLTWVGEYFFKKKEETFKKQSYECGFKNNTNINIQINLNFAIVCVFLILYDVEFSFLIPFYFNINQINIYSLFIFFIFIFFIFISLIFDYQLNSLNWSV